MLAALDRILNGNEDRDEDMVFGFIKKAIPWLFAVDAVTADSDNRQEEFNVSASLLFSACTYTAHQSLFLERYPPIALAPEEIIKPWVSDNFSSFLKTSSPYLVQRAEETFCAQAGVKLSEAASGLFRRARLSTVASRLNSSHLSKPEFSPPDSVMSFSVISSSP